MTLLSDRRRQNFHPLGEVLFFVVLPFSRVRFSHYDHLSAEKCQGLLIFWNEFSRLLLNLLFLMNFLPVCASYFDPSPCLHSCFIFLMAFMYLIFNLILFSHFFLILRVENWNMLCWWSDFGEMMIMTSTTCFRHGTTNKLTAEKDTVSCGNLCFNLGPFAQMIKPWKPWDEF